MPGSGESEEQAITPHSAFPCAQRSEARQATALYEAWGRQLHLCVLVRGRRGELAKRRRQENTSLEEHAVASATR